MGIRVVKVGFDETGSLTSRLQIFVILQDLRGSGQGGDHQAVPGSEDLVVEEGSESFSPQLEKKLSRSLPGLLYLRSGKTEFSGNFFDGLSLIEDVLPCEFRKGIVIHIAFGPDPEEAQKHLCRLGV